MKEIDVFKFHNLNNVNTEIPTDANMCLKIITI